MQAMCPRDHARTSTARSRSRVESLAVSSVCRPCAATFDVFDR
jgi:hypothetical protein